MKRLKRVSAGNVSFLGEVTESQLKNLYAHCRALLFAADEDFGMVPLEAQSYGRPVIAFGKGGALETVVGRFPETSEHTGEDYRVVTGIFFREQTADSLAKAICFFERVEAEFFPPHIQRHARKFDTAIFVERIRDYIECAMVNGSKG